jgi:hypothetical protein
MGYHAGFDLLNHPLILRALGVLAGASCILEYFKIFSFKKMLHIVGAFLNLKRDRVSVSLFPCRNPDIDSDNFRHIKSPFLKKRACDIIRLVHGVIILALGLIGNIYIIALQLVAAGRFLRFVDSNKT